MELTMKTTQERIDEIVKNYQPADGSDNYVEIDDAILRGLLEALVLSAKLELLKEDK